MKVKCTLYNLHYEKFADGTVECIEDKIPFETPNGWVWTRLGSISSAIQYGLSNSAEQIGTQRLLRITDIQDGKVNWDTVPFTTVQDPEPYLLTKGDIVFARTGATVGKSFLIEETPYPAVYASYLIRIRLLDSILPEYIYQFFNSQCYWDQITDKSVGVGQPNCNGTSLKELLIPLPPVYEQSKIVHSSRSAIEYVTSIEDQKNLLLEDISTIKSKILDLAIRGKLVPQNPEDEPASMLLERIRAEKEELIKQGKIKRDKKESVIFKGEDNSYYEKIGVKTICIDDQLPFEIPQSWYWVRISTIGLINPRNSLADHTEVSFVPMPLIQEGYSNAHTFDTRNWKDVKTGFTHFAENDVGVAKITPCFENKKSVVFKNLCNGFGAGTTELHIIRTFDNMVYPEYLLWCLKTDSFISGGINAFSGAVGQKRIGKDFISDYLIPIPPREEQDRIVKKINEIFSFVSHIEKSLS